MAKIRIHELAKELGVENKVIVGLATELKIAAKASHSSSLDASEADQIRRAILRKAMGGSPDVETVTSYIDKDTGEAAKLVERRKGGVIRRRREAVASDDVHEPVEVTETHEAEIATSPSLEQEKEIESAEEEISAEPVVEEVILPAEEAPALTAPAVVEPSVPAAVQQVAKPTVGGPRVLGKIELVKRKVVKTPAKKPLITEAKPAVRSATEEEDEESRNREKRRTKKVEFTRGDLVDYEGRGPRRGKSKGGKKEDIFEKSPSAESTGPKKKIVKMGDAIVVGELAKQMSLKSSEIISKLIELGVMATINQALDFDTATIISEEFGYTIEKTSFDETEVLGDAAQDQEVDLRSRPPVVTVMGHVDHGKTSLLDTIRKASVAAKEAGGITQHIGAYSVSLEEGRTITFIDTPGHAAFTAMRARGAHVTDIVILVVAADDGVMPQTIEAINHAKAAKVPIVVAVNKIDKREANPDRVKQQLAEQGLAPEEWGGETMYYPVSALKGTGVKELLEGVCLVAEMKELKANPGKRAKGAIIEARQETGRGVVATVLVQNGTLKIGDIFVAGSMSGKVRSMNDFKGARLAEAPPSTPVEITGFAGMPVAGDDFTVVPSEADAREVTENRINRNKERELLTASGPISLEEFARRANSLAAAELNIICKTDVHGSLEAVKNAIEKLSTDKVRVKVIHSGVGGINETDVQLAMASNAIIVGFGVRAEPRAMAEATTHGVDVRFYRIIYELLDDVKKAMAGLLAPIRQEVRLGRVEVRNTFNIPKVGTVAGCYVSDGTVKRNALLRLLRDSRVVHEGKLLALKRFKDDVREVETGYECGISIEGYNDVKTGDVMEIFEIKETPASLD